MSVLFQSLLWIGLPLIAVPVLIHLINLRRQRRIRWAAMQFLLESQRRNRKWILLKQLLLMLARMAAIAVLVYMLAQVSVSNEWFRLLGRGATHHLILIDDSYSMSDRWSETSAFEEGKRSVQAIVDQAYQQSDRHLVTLLTFSEAVRLGAGGEPKIYQQQINDALRSQLETTLAGQETSQTDVGPAEALKTVLRLPLENADETLIVYLVGDFRERQFVGGTEIRDLLADVKDRAAQVHLVRCVQETRPNLAVTALTPVSGVRAAGVEMWMNVTVANYGDEPARGVTLQLEQDGDALPAIALESIPPRDEVTNKFRVQFTGTGAHWLSATLPADPVAVDNRRWFACLLPAARPVLIVDGSKDSRGGRQLTLALAPGGTTRTGWQPHIEPARFLADVDRLHQQAAICLLDVPRLAEDELAGLESYVAEGGGVAFIVGSETDRAYYNDRLYRNGEGLFPVPLRQPSQLHDRDDDLTPDVEVTDHDLFKVLSGRRNSFVELLFVEYYYAVPDDWAPPADGSTRIIARLRNQAPLVVEKHFGEGRVIAQLTRLSPAKTPLGSWSNWSLNPAFPVLANELVNYLSAGDANDEVHQIGQELIVTAPETEYEPTLRITFPGDGPTRKEESITAVPTAGQLIAKLPDPISVSGVYRAQLQQKQGGAERRDFAFNVALGEGDLHVVHRDELAKRLDGVDFVIHDAADMVVGEQILAGFQMGDTLLGALIVILLAEQLLAYAASYHIRG